VGQRGASASRAAEVLGWWAVLTGVGVCLVGTVDVWESSLMALIALAAAVLAVVARLAEGTSFRLRWSWAAAVLRLPVQVVRDAVLLLAAIARRRSRGGDWRTLPTGAAAGGPLERTRRALVIATMSAAPGSYLAGLDDDGVAVVHELGADAAAGLHRSLRGCAP
jgi:hypothetical protein